MNEKRLLLNLHPNRTGVSRCVFDLPGILALFVSVGVVLEALSPTSTYAAPNPATEAIGDTIDEFIAARAAAEVCLALTISQADDEVFVRWLQLRDPLRRSEAELRRAVADRLPSYREALYAAQCKSQAAINAQSAWLNRVEILLPSKRKVLMGLDDE